MIGPILGGTSFIMKLIIIKIFVNKAVRVIFAPFIVAKKILAYIYRYTKKIMKFIYRKTRRAL